ncbi:MAG: DUF5698 domain-containing protein [Bacilli bacterium]
MNILFLCIKIFFTRIVDVTLGTLRTIITVKDKIFLASVIGFFEVLVWFLIAKEALDTASSSVLIGVFYALGFACGTYIGGKLSRRFIKGNLTVQVITSKASDKWLSSLRESGFAVSVMDIRQKDDDPDKYMFFMEINKNDFDKLHKLIKKFDKDAFIVVNESKVVINGYFSQK